MDWNKIDLRIKFIVSDKIDTQSKAGQNVI